MKRLRVVLLLMALLVVSAFTYAVNAGACEKTTSGQDLCPTAVGTYGL